MEPTFPPEKKPTPIDESDLNNSVEQPVPANPGATIQPGVEAPSPQPTQPTQPTQPVQPTQSFSADEPVTDSPVENAPAGVVSSSGRPLFSSDQNPIMSGANNAGGRSNKKLFTIIIGVLAGFLLIGGGIAAAYYGVMVPNKPENVLKQALINTAQEKNIALDGQYEMSSIDTKKEDAIPAVKIDFDGKTNTEQKQSELKLNLTVSGVNLPVDARLIDNTAYVKVGDLSTISSLVSGYAPSMGFDAATVKPLIDDVSGLLSDQWIEFDSTLFDQAGVSCVVDTKFTLTDDDIKLLEDQFTKNQFAKIESHSDETVDGKSAIKYQVNIDDDKLAKFGEDKKLEQLSFVKALKKCPGAKDNPASSIAGTADGDVTPITIWVDKGSKRIVKLAGQSTKQDAEKSNLKASFNATVGYDKVSVSKPENAKPAMQVWGELQQKLTPYFGSLFSGGLDSSTDIETFTEEDITDASYSDFITQ